MTGFALALALTFIAFGVAVSGLSKPTALLLIGAAALIQVLVHLRYFLHLELRPMSAERLPALVFAAVLIMIMIGGSLWIMFDLNYRMWAYATPRQFRFPPQYHSIFQQTPLAKPTLRQPGSPVGVPWTMFQESAKCLESAAEARPVPLALA